MPFANKPLRLLSGEECGYLYTFAGQIAYSSEIEIGRGGQYNPTLVWHKFYISEVLRQQLWEIYYYIIAVVLIIFWLLGFFVYSVGYLIHILLVFAIIAILVRVIRGEKAV
ncbi:MAG: lmo0937 family membrane protein [Chryseotalea sp. WA131a]|nr:MAG: lmo0937 family membrane protein [Chryseotalea sp. WA131a]